MNRPFIMIVEDDVELGDIISSVLEDSGLHTETVRDGDMALDRITATEPDVILLDMHLPNVSGSEILANIRSTPKLSQTRVVITTADALLGRANEDKGDLVLIKPITFDQLLNLTTRLTKTSQAMFGIRSMIYRTENGQAVTCPFSINMKTCHHISCDQYQVQTI